MAIDRRGHLRPVERKEFWRLRRSVSALQVASLDAPNHDLSKSPLHGSQFLRAGRASIGLVQVRNFSVRKLQPTVPRRAAPNVVEVALVEGQTFEVFDPRRIRE